MEQNMSQDVVPMSNMKMIYDISPETMAWALQSEERWESFPSLTLREENNLKAFLKKKYPDMLPEERFNIAKDFVSKRGWKQQPSDMPQQKSTPTAPQTTVETTPQTNDTRRIKRFETWKLSKDLVEHARKVSAWETTPREDIRWFVKWWELALKTAANIPIWAVNTVWDLIQMVTNPKQTIQWMRMLWVGVKDYLAGNDTEEAKMVDSMIDMAKESFESPEAAVETLTENPFDFITALSPKTWMSALSKTWIATSKTVSAAKNIWWAWIKRMVSGLTWVSEDAIDEALKKAWKLEFVQAMKWETGASQVVSDVKAGLETLVSNKRSIYWKWWEAIKVANSWIDLDALKKWFIEELKSKKINVVPVVSKPSKVRTPIMWDLWPVKPQKPKYRLDFSGSWIRKTSEWVKELQDTFDDIMSWTDTSVDWMDTLKQRIRSWFRWWQDTWLSDSIHTSFSKQIWDQLWENISWYSDITKKYKEAVDAIDEIKRSFALWKKNLPQQTYNRLKNIYKWDKQLTKELFKSLDNLSKKDLTAQLAWLQFSSLAPSGIMWRLVDASIIIWATSWTFWLWSILLMWLSSPRIMWELLNWLWMASNKVKNVVNNISEISKKIEPLRKNINKNVVWQWMRAAIVEWNIPEVVNSDDMTEED